MEKKTFVVWHDGFVCRADKNRLNKHRSGLIWLTGLSAAGKSTIANVVEKELFERGIRTYVLDGDNIRNGLNGDLGFSPEDRKENIRRIGEVAKLMVDAGLIVLTAFISPYREDRDTVRKFIDDDDFIEVYVKCSLAECERRDPKGLYKKARQGLIRNYTGISAPYEAPESPDLIVDTENLCLEDSRKCIIDHLIKKNFLSWQSGHETVY
jgi:adenylylsulfate kinase